MINTIFSYFSKLNSKNITSKVNIIDISFIIITLFTFGNLFPFNILLVFLITQAYNKDPLNIFKSFTKISFDYYTKIITIINKSNKNTNSKQESTNTEQSILLQKNINNSMNNNNDINTKCHQKVYQNEDDYDSCNNNINSEYHQNDFLQQHGTNIQKNMTEMSKDLCSQNRDILDQQDLGDSNAVCSNYNNDINTDDKEDKEDKEDKDYNDTKEKYDFDAIRDKIKNSFDNIRFSIEKNTNQDIDQSKIY